jgi:hypothetical protein
MDIEMDEIRLRVRMLIKRYRKETENLEDSTLISDAVNRVSQDGHVFRVAHVWFPFGKSDANSERWGMSASVARAAAEPLRLTVQGFAAQCG